MGSLFGRDAEIARGRAVLDSAARDHIVRALRLAGPTGVGKTALAEALVQNAGPGWLAVWAPSFRIHASLPLFAARRVLQSLLTALGDSAERYRSGLTVDRDRPDEFEEAFLRIFEGVTLDHRVLLVLDDAQWADPESRALIERTFTALADRSIVLVSTERSDESGAAALGLTDEAIALGELQPQAAMQVVRAIYPEVTGEVAESIVAQTRGRAVDIVAVATAARESGAKTLRDVSASTRRVVARDLSLLDASVREFLQLCALIDEPIDLAILQQLYPQNRLFEMIDAVSGRYLVSNANALRFVHSTVMESVLETIPIEIPLRHRIVDAIKKFPAPRLEDYERLSEQAAACGDRATEREALVKLSEEAAAKSLISLSANTLERALAIAPPSPDEIVPTYARLSQMLNVLARESDAITACRRAFTEAETAGVSDGLGQIAASSALAQLQSGLAQEARDTVERYARLVKTDAERAEISTIGEFISMQRVDVEDAQRYRTQYERYNSNAHPMVVIRHHVANAFLAMRTGDEQGALQRIKSADLASEKAPAIYATMPLAARLYHTYRYRGVDAAEQFIAQLGPRAKLPPVQTIAGHLMISRGDFNDVEEYVGDKLQSSSDSLMRRILLSQRYTAAAFRGLDPADGVWQHATQDVAAFEAGERNNAVFPIIVASLIPLAARSRERARKLLRDVLDAARQPMDVMTFLYPVLLSNAAKALADTPALETIAAGKIWTDQQPLNTAHHALAQGVAKAALGQAGNTELLEATREALLGLGATYFAALAAEAAGKQKASVRDGKIRANNTTRRECEIAGLVAEGLTNREIAERLVLSERTVEGHIANLFAKVNVNSRTQLATWFMRTMSPAAS